MSLYIEDLLQTWSIRIWKIRTSGSLTNWVAEFNNFPSEKAEKLRCEKLTLLLLFFNWYIYSPFDLKKITFNPKLRLLLFSAHLVWEMKEVEERKIGWREKDSLFASMLILTSFIRRDKFYLSVFLTFTLLEGINLGYESFETWVGFGFFWQIHGHMSLLRSSLYLWVQNSPHMIFRQLFGPWNLEQ